MTARRFLIPNGDGLRAKPDCVHERVTRVAPLYVDGRPLYKCEDCGVRFVYENDEPSAKALVPLRSEQ